MTATNHQSLVPGSKVVLNKDITRIEGPYAQKGERGTVVECFLVNQSGCPGRGVLHVKVLMTDEYPQVVKTFRVTSLSKEE